MVLSTKSVQLSNNEVSFGLKNEKLNKKLLALGADGLSRSFISMEIVGSKD